MLDFDIREFGPSARVQFAKHLVVILCFGSTLNLISYEHGFLSFAIGYLVLLMDMCLSRD